MFNSLDLLIIAVMILGAAGLLSLALMFLLKNRTAQRVFRYIAAALGVYVGTVGFRINWPGFPVQVILAVVFALAAIGAVVLERIRKGDGKAFLTARVIGAAALLLGMLNAFFV